MSLSIVAEPAISHKLEYLLRNLKSKDEVLILCATSAQEGDIGRSLAARALPPSQGGEFDKGVDVLEFRPQSFASFNVSMWNRWGDQRDLVGAAIRHKIMSDVLDRGHRRQKIAPALLSPGGRVLLSRLATSYTPQQKAACKSFSRERTRGHETAIRSILEEYYQELKKEEYVEHQYALLHMADALSKGLIDSPSTKIVVSGFKDFSFAQLNMIFALAKKSEVVVLLDYDKGNPAAEYLADTLERLVDGGGKLSSAISLLDSPGETDEEACASKELRWLQDSFLTEGATQALLPKSLLENAALSLGKAQGRAAEIALMVDCAQKAHEEHPHEAKALLVSRLSSYVRPLSRELERRKIPFELDIKTPFGATGFGAALFALLQICTDENALLAASAFVASSYSGLSPEQALELDTKWRRSRASNSKILSALSFHESEACAFLKLIKGYNYSARIGDWHSLITQMYAHAAHVQFLGTEEKAARALSNFDLMQEAAAQKAASSALQELYEQHYGVYVAGADSPEGTCATTAAEGEEESPEDVGQEVYGQPGKRVLNYDPIISAAELYAVLFELSVAQTPRPGSPAILVSEPSRIYGRSFHTVIVGGLSAQDERERVDVSLEANLAAVLAGVKPADVMKQKHLEYYSMIGAAQKKLCLIAQNRELSGVSLRSGDFLSAIEDCLGEEACKKLSIFKEQDSIIADQSFANAEKQKDFEHILAGQSVSQVKIPEHGLDANYDLGYGDGARVSPSTLESYAFCPYKWFLDNLARGKELDKGVGVAEQGKLAHQVLRVFYERLSLEKIGRRVTEDNLADALCLFDLVFGEEQAALRQKNRLTAAEEAELVNLQHHMRNFIKSEPYYAPEFIPTYFEQEFGFEASKELDLGIGLPLAGIVDRIDVREDDRAAIIIDYKRSVNMGQIEAQASNKVMQGVLYRKAAEKTLDLHAVAHDYRSYLNPKHYKVAYSQDDNPPERPLGLPKIGRKKDHWGENPDITEQALNSIMESAAAAAEGLRLGAIGIREKSSARCSYCIFDACIHWKPRWNK